MNRSERYAIARKFRGGFTLVELMVVVLIIGLLASIVSVNVVGYISKAKIAKAQADIRQLDNAVTQFRIDTDQYPDNASGLLDLIQQPPGVINWETSGYLHGITMVPKDPWGNEYLYEYDGGNLFLIYSLGPDGEDGTDDDITNSDDGDGDSVGIE